MNMAFVSDCSCECTKSELDLFAVPDTQTSVESSTYAEYHPVTSLVDGSTIEFEMSGTGEDYLDLNHAYLHVKAKVTRNDGSNLPADDPVAPVNYFLHSLFSQVDIYLNGTQITSSTNTYPYRAVMEALLSYGEDAKKTQLASALFAKDEAGKMDSRAVDANANKGFLTRRRKARESRTIEMMGRIHTDIFFQERYMLNEVGVKVRLTRSKDTFCLIGDDQRTVKILSAKMFVRKARLSPSVMLGHAKALEESNAKYPIKRVVCKSFTIPAGVRDVNQEKLCSGQLPTRLVFGLVDNEAFNGSIERNPFNFAHFNVSEVGVYVDGQQGQLIKPMKIDFESDQYIESYMNLFAGMNKINRDEGNCIEPEDFAGGYALYAYDLTPDLCEGDHFNLMKQGSIRLALRFSTALARAVTVVAYTEFENVIEIDRSRNVIYDFAA